MNKQEYYKKGDDFYSQEKYWDAIDNFEKALELDSNYTDALHMTGVCFERLNMYEEAFEFYIRNISIDPEYTYSQYGAGNMLYRLKRYNEAYYYFKECITLDPNFAVGYDSLGLTLEKLGKKKEAKEALNKAMDLDTERDDFRDHFEGISERIENTSKYHKEGTKLYRENSFKEALDKFEQATMADPYDAEAWHMRGLQHERMHNYNEALLCYERALEIDPSLNLSLIGVANMNLILRNYDKSKEYYNKALKYDEYIDEIKSKLEILEEKISKKKIYLYFTFSNFDLQNFQIKKLRDDLLKYEDIADIIFLEDTDFVPDDERRYFFDKSNYKFDCLILFCTSNTTNNKLMRSEWYGAYSANKPVICICDSVKNIPAILRNKDNSVIWDPVDYNGVKEKLYKLITEFFEGFKIDEILDLDKLDFDLDFEDEDDNNNNL